MIREIKERLNEKEVELKHKPLTSWIDFDSAISVFNNWRKYLVITRVDKAANCLCIICKACYIQLATEEMEGPGYSRAEREDLVSIKSVIDKRQLDFLRQEFLPIPHVRKRSDKNPLQTVLNPTERLPVRYITVKLHKNPVATRGITACCESPLDGIARIVNACLVALRPVLHVLRREKCLEIGILTDECWITSSGTEIIDIIHAVDIDARSYPGPVCPHKFETYDFVAMYPNLPDATLQDVMRKLLEYTFEYQNQHELLFIEILWGFADNHTNPVVRQAFWSSKQPQPVTVNSKKHVWVRPAKIFQWLTFVLDEGFVQFGPHMYRQTSGVFMGTSPAPELANNFSFWHEYEFLSHMVNEYKQIGPCRYPFQFINQFATRTKRYIDDISTVSLGHMSGISLMDVISQEGTFYGMYPITVLDFDGNVRPSPISIVQDQQGPNVHFLDMQIMQLYPGIGDVKMYDKRDSMPALASYRKFPHIETTVSTSCKYAVFHSQLCRFAYRCTRRDYFVGAASRLRPFFTRKFFQEILGLEGSQNFLGKFR